jgi:hypothetical protein
MDVARVLRVPQFNNHAARNCEIKKQSLPSMRDGGHHINLTWG